MKKGESVLKEEQILFIRNNFSTMRNPELAKVLGVCQSTVHRVARQYGLKKDPEWERHLRIELGAEIKKIKNERGTHPKKGTFSGTQGRKFSKEYNLTTLFTPEQRAVVHAKGQKTRNETIRRDKLRRKFGLSPITKFRNLGGYCHRDSSWRCNARKRGYIVERGEMTAYYTEETTRGVKFENNGTRHGFTILPLGGTKEIRHIVRRVDDFEGMADIVFQ